MKKTYLFLIIALFAGILSGSCQKEGSDVKPGLYVEQEVIKTFPTDTLRLKGTASNYVGLNSVVLSCEAWKFEQVYDLSSQTPKVFNYDHQLIVPYDASFQNITLDVTVTDINGLQTVKNISVEELPDFIPPTSTPVLPEQVAVNYDFTTKKGEWTIFANLYDRRGLKSVKLEVPGLSISKTEELSGQKTDWTTTVTFTEMGNYDVAVTVTDLAGNNMVMVAEAVVMTEVEADPVQDWNNLFLSIAGEDPADYVDGFYKYMDKAYADGSATPYCYQTTFYAPTADTKVYITPTKSLDADIIGVNPNVSTMILNKAGFVEPIPVPSAGYYGIWVDILNGTFSFWNIDAESSATKCSEDVWISGTGFGTFADWGATPEAMTRDGYRHTQNLEVKAGTVSYYFYTAGWARVFRADVNSYWWFESADGSVAGPSTDYSGPVEVIFDSVLPYGVIKKVTE